MELLINHLRIGIAAPPLLSPSRNSRKLNAVTGGSNSSSTNSFSITSKWADRLLPDFQFFPSNAITNADNSDQNFGNSSSTATLGPSPPPPPALTERHVSMPIDFYRILGAEAHFLGDGIRRAYEAKVSKPPQYGYSQDALVSRRQVLQAACDTLANSTSRREYNQNLADDEFDTILTQVPWEKVNLKFSKVNSYCSSNYTDTLLIGIIWSYLFVCLLEKLILVSLLLRYWSFHTRC